jgi:hypothetical protein
LILEGLEGGEVDHFVVGGGGAAGAATGGSADGHGFLMLAGVFGVAGTAVVAAELVFGAGLAGDVDAAADADFLFADLGGGGLGWGGGRDGDCEDDSALFAAEAFAGVVVGEVVDPGAVGTLGADWHAKSPGRVSKAPNDEMSGRAGPTRGPLEPEGGIILNGPGGGQVKLLT